MPSRENMVFFCNNKARRKLVFNKEGVREHYLDDAWADTDVSGMIEWGSFVESLEKQLQDIKELRSKCLMGK